MRSKVSYNTASGFNFCDVVSSWSFYLFFDIMVTGVWLHGGGRGHRRVVGNKIYHTHRV